jgi:hypothetical protein
MGAVLISERTSILVSLDLTRTRDILAAVCHWS